MKVKIPVLIVIAILIAGIAAAAVIAAEPQLPEEPPPPEQITVGDTPYITADYLSGCIFAALKNYSSVSQINQQGLNATAAVLYSSLLYLYEINSLDRDVFPCVEYMSMEEAAEYYGSAYQEFNIMVRSAAKYAMNVNVTYGGENVFLPLCRISSGALIDPAECNMNMPWCKKLYCLTDRDEPRYSGGCQLTSDGFTAVFLTRFPSAVLPPDIGGWISDIKTDTDGNVLSVSAGGVTMSGWEFCQLFGIRSVCFEMTYTDRLFSFTSKGDGGSAGISVAAAMQLGARGDSAEEIIKTFFEVDINAAYTG
ncbi:MAG: hypothetical protein J1E39_02660 [Eubacterium sp.]|nr:hypothetical protein [Eubacterium sp.]